MITFGALLPHPPIMIEGIGQADDLDRVKSTREAMGVIDGLLSKNPPDTLVVFTPHGTVYQDAMIVYADPSFSGNLQRFGLNRNWCWDNDWELAEQIAKLGQDAGLPVYSLEQAVAGRAGFPEGLDHGVLVPLSFFTPQWSKKVKLLVIPLSYLPLEELYRFGSLIQSAAQKLNRRVAVIASGDLSHCLQPGAPAGFNPRGAEFDQKLIGLLQEGAVKEFFDFDPVMLEKAAECGFRSLIMLLGTLDSIDFKVVVHSYEGPFGVGYGVASFTPMGKRESFVEDLLNSREQKIEKRRSQESPLVKYARQVVETYVMKTELAAVTGLDEFNSEQAGVFVSIKKHGQLRGCIGTTEPTQKNIVKEVKQNAISASTRDPRFDPVEPDELGDLVYSVDVLKPAEPVSGLEALDPQKYGVIVTSGHRKGLLLPMLEGVETVEDQVAIAKKKAGIGAGEPVSLERFEVVRYY